MRLRIALLALGAALALMSPAAAAAFRGQNGMLAVQPIRGHGVLLVDPHNGHSRMICTDVTVCGHPRRPRWAPDGRTLVFYSPNVTSIGGGDRIIYSDGSCLDCEPFGGPIPAFTTDPSVFVATRGRQLVRYGSDGLRRGVVVPAGVANAVWASNGALAIVRHGDVEVGVPRALRSLGAGSAPSWSPSGRQIVVVRRRWLTVIDVHTHRARRLVRGGAPAWSPDGGWIAFIGSRHRLELIRASGRAPRSVARVRGAWVDWQPRPEGTPTCTLPPGSTVLASSTDASVTQSGTTTGNGETWTGPAYMGCLTSTGRVVLLQRYGFESIDTSSTDPIAAVAAPYAALVQDNEDMHYGGQNQLVEVYDLRTGALVSGLGGEAVACDGYSCDSSMDAVVVNAQGYTAAHVNILTGTGCPPGLTACRTEQLLARGSAGVETLDTATVADNAPPALTGLALSGDTVSWKHDGMPESAQLS